MNVAQNLIFITAYYIYFKLLMIPFFVLMTLVESGINDSIFILMILAESSILLKNHVTCNLC